MICATERIWNQQAAVQIEDEEMRFFLSKGQAAVLTAMLGSALVAGAANAQSNCDAYARLTLEQARANVAKRCGFKGPRWSLKAEAHKQWCQDVGPDEWRSELKLRNEQLAKCKG